MRIEKKLLASVVGPVVALAAFASFLACGSEATGEASSAVKGGNDPNATMDATADAIGAIDAGMLVGDAGDGGDAAKAAALPNPGKITCGASECVVNQEACCLSGDAGVCEEMGGACHSNGPNRARLECDETADCDDGDGDNDEVCVWFQSSDGLSTECRSKDGDDDHATLACKTDAECGASGACKVHVCADGRTIQSCGPLGDVCP